MTENMETTLDPTSILEQSEQDDRKYKLITLPNKLKCLLISDQTTDKAAAAMDGKSQIYSILNLIFLMACTYTCGIPLLLCFKYELDIFLTQKMLLELRISLSICK